MQSSYERPPKPPTFWNSYTRTLILDTIMKLSGTIGVTQKTMTLDTHVRLILLQTLNPQERWGTHKKRWPFQPRLFADVIGLVRCSYVWSDSERQVHPTMEKLEELQLHVVPRRASEATLSRDCSQLLTASWDRSAKLWPLQTFRKTRTAPKKKNIRNKKTWATNEN